MSNENQSLPGCSEQNGSGPLPSGFGLPEAFSIELNGGIGERDSTDNEGGCGSGGTGIFCGGTSPNNFQVGTAAPPAPPPPSRPPAQAVGSPNPIKALLGGTREMVFAAIVFFIIVSFLAYLALQDGSTF
jgi:hypothetical protein